MSPTVTLQNPTAAEIIAAFVAADIPPTDTNEHGVFETPFGVTLVLGKGKAKQELTLLLACLSPSQWQGSWKTPSVGEKCYLDIPLDTWEEAVIDAMERAEEVLRDEPWFQEKCVPLFKDLTQELRPDPSAAADSEAGEYTDEQGRRWVPVDKLKINPALNVVPMVSSVAAQLMGSTTADGRAAGAEISAERDAFFASLDEQGILEDLKGHEEDDGTLLVDDGRHRLEWAIARGETHVPFKQLTREQGEALAEATVIGRRHWTKGQRAYLGVLLHPEVATGEKRGQHKKGKPETLLTANDLAERLGVSADVVLQAVKLYTLFHAPGAKKGSAEEIEAADLKAKFEVSIWAGAGLGGVLAGIGGGISTKDKPKPASSFHGLEKPLATLSTLSKSWSKWDEAERSKAKKLITTRLKELDGDFRLALSEALAAAE